MLADSLLSHSLRKYLSRERVVIALNGTVLTASVDKRLFDNERETCLIEGFIKKD